MVFFFGVFNKRLNAKGCLAALGVGFAMGLFRLAIDTPVALTEGFAYEEGSFFWLINSIFFQYYSLLIFLVCAATMIIVSYATEAPAAPKVAGLTFSTLSEDDRAQNRASWTQKDVIASVLVIVLILAAYLYFNG